MQTDCENHKGKQGFTWNHPPTLPTSPALPPCPMSSLLLLLPLMETLTVWGKGGERTSQPGTPTYW